MAGQTMSVSVVMAAGDPNTLPPSAARSIVPSGATISSPKAATTWAKGAVPGSYARWPSLSASITVAPRSASLAVTVDLPEAMPPLRPIERMRLLSVAGTRVPAAVCPGLGPATPLRIIRKGPRGPVPEASQRPSAASTSQLNGAVRRRSARPRGRGAGRPSLAARPACVPQDSDDPARGLVRSRADRGAGGAGWAGRGSGARPGRRPCRKRHCSVMARGPGCDNCAAGFPRRHPSAEFAW